MPMPSTGHTKRLRIARIAVGRSEVTRLSTVELRVKKSATAVCSSRSVFALHRVERKGRRARRRWMMTREKGKGRKRTGGVDEEKVTYTLVDAS
jgi:hypothetical protein